MKIVYILPITLIIIDIIAGIIYGVNGDYKRLIYWFAAATLTTTVTF